MPGLTGLRGWAAMLVFLYHLRWLLKFSERGPAGEILDRTFQTFDFGVCLFFVLSGFLLSRPMWKVVVAGKGLSELNWQSYFIRRITRILPAYYLILICFFLFEPASYTAKGAGGVLAHFLCLQTFFDDYYTLQNPVLWTIAIEFQFYLLLPPLMWSAAWAYRKGRLAGSLLVLCTLVFLSNRGYEFLARQAVAAIPGGMLNWSAGGPAVTRSVFYYLKWFLPGILAAGVHTRCVTAGGRENDSSPQNHRPAWHWDLLFCIAVGCAAVLLNRSSEAEWRFVSLWGWPLNVTIVAVLVTSIPHSRVANLLLENRFTIFLGEISYGLYLWHYPLQKALAAGISPRLYTSDSFLWWGSLLACLLSLLIATFSYVFVERPAIRTGHQTRSFRELMGYFRL